MNPLKAFSGASLVALLVICGSGVAAEPAEYAGLNARADALFEKWDTTISAGCSMAVSRDGAIIHERGYGMANLEHGVPNRPDTVFHIASVSKQFTAAAIAMLILDGKLAASDPIRKYLPELPQFEQGITVDHLIHHESGLRDFSDVMELSGWRYYRDLVTMEDAMSVLMKQKGLVFTPGSRYQYSNTNYLLMALIVERVSGKSFRQFTTERIFEPLGMKDSFFRDDFPEIVPNFAAGYDEAHGVFKTSLTQFSTTGYSSLLTTVRDLMKWEENFHTARVGGKALIDMMLTPGRLNDGKPNKYAFGIVVDEHRGIPMIDHSGGDAGYATHMVRFPEQHLSIAVLCNIGNIGASELAMAAAEIYLGLEPLPMAPTHQAPVKAVAVSLRDLESKVGNYLNAGTEQAVTIRLRDGKLYALSGNDRDELTPLAANRFSMREGRWELEFAKGPRRPSRLTLHDLYDGPQALERIADFDPGATELEAYAGTYSSDEIDAPYTLRVIDGQLVLRSIKFKSALTPVATNLFAAGWANVRFERDDAGRIRGFSYGRKDDILARFERAAARD